MAYTIETNWEVCGYDVWGNEEDGFEVTDTYRRGEIHLELDVETCNPATERQFITAYPSDSQIKEALDIYDHVEIETEGDDLHVYVTAAKDGYPLGELYCTSHDSLSPIRQA